MEMLIRSNKIPRRKAQDMILAMVKYSNGSSSRFKTDADVKRYLATLGYDFNDLVRKSMEDYNCPIPTENLLGSTWKISGGTATIISAGRETLKIEGPGEITQKAYWGIYEESIGQLKESISCGSYTKCQSAISLGISSIEAYIGYRVEQWNEVHPTEALIDSKENKVSFDDKINYWIPHMTKNKKLDKSNKIWQDYKILRDIRDNTTVHAKKSSYGVSYDDLTDLIGKYSFGISGMLMELHKLFNDPIPPAIIRNFYAPPVTMLEGSDNPQCITNDHSVSSQSF